MSLRSLAAILVLGGFGAAGISVNSARSMVTWERVRPGVELGELPYRGGGEGRWTRLILVRIDPALHRMRLDLGLSADYRNGEWSVDSAPGNAVVAFNAGQFNGIAPWGWTVKDGRELRPPGIGPLSTAIIEDRDGGVRLVPPDSIPAARASGTAVTVIQSYPTLLEGNGAIPRQITSSGLGVGVTDRDARLALCALPNGKLLVLLTRFDGLGEVGGGIPFGLTLAETARLLKQQGCVRAVALDGGISSQLLVRDAGGVERAWRGWRKVPLGVVFEER